eukprot:gene2426-5366_t
MAYDYRGDDLNTSMPYQVDRHGNSMDDSDSLSRPAPSLFLIGQRSCGKTSISKVVFHKMSPNETIFLETTRNIESDMLPQSSFLDLQIIDFPGDFELFERDDENTSLLKDTNGAVVFVIDAQDETDRVTAALCRFIQEAFAINKNLHFEVLIHKVDALGTEEKRAAMHSIIAAVHEGLYGVEVQISYYLTSIYDVSIFEAMSKIAQKLVPQFPSMQGMLDTLAGRSNIMKAFLFDISTKIYVASDSRNVELDLYEACSDSIDVVTDVSGVFGHSDTRPSVSFDDSTEGEIPINDLLLYLRQVTPHLILVCVVERHIFQPQAAIIKSNVSAFRQSIQELFSLYQ